MGESADYLSKEGIDECHTLTEFGGEMKKDTNAT